MNRFPTLAAVLVAVAVTLSGCAEESAAPIKEKADSPAEVVESEDGSAAEEGDVEDGSEGDDEATAALGDLVTVGSWDVKVTKVVRNAGDVIEKANEFNDPAKRQYVLVTYEATYTGEERTADINADLTWTLTGADAQVNDTASVVSPADNEEWPTTARRNGTVRGQAAFDVPASQLAGALITVEGYDEDFDTVYADFAIG